MKTLLLLLALQGCSAGPIVIETPTPLSVVFYEQCGVTKVAVITMTDGGSQVVSEYSLQATPGLVAQLEDLPHTTIYIASAETCGCFT